MLCASGGGNFLGGGSFFIAGGLAAAFGAGAGMGLFATFIGGFVGAAEAFLTSGFAVALFFAGATTLVGAFFVPVPVVLAAAGFVVTCFFAGATFFAAVALVATDFEFDDFEFDDLGGDDFEFDDFDVAFLAAAFFEAVVELDDLAGFFATATLVWVFFALAAVTRAAADFFLSGAALGAGAFLAATFPDALLLTPVLTTVFLDVWAMLTYSLKDGLVPCSPRPACGAWLRPRRPGPGRRGRRPWKAPDCSGRGDPSGSPPPGPVDRGPARRRSGSRRALPSDVDPDRLADRQDVGGPDEVDRRVGHAGAAVRRGERRHRRCSRAPRCPTR